MRRYRKPCLVLTRETLLLALELLGVALDRGSALALAGLAGLLEKLATAYFGDNARFLAAAFESTQGDFERFVFFDAYARH